VLRLGTVALNCTGDRAWVWAQRHRAALRAAPSCACPGVITEGETEARAGANQAAAPNPPDPSASAPTEQPSPAPLACPPAPCSPTAQPLGRGRETARKHRQTREGGWEQGWVWGEAEPPLGSGPAPQGRHGPCSCPPPVRGAGGGAVGGTRRGQGAGSTYSTGSWERAEASPAPPGRRTGERKGVRAPRPALAPRLMLHRLTSSWSRMALSCSSFLAQYLASSSGISARAKTPLGAQTPRETASQLLGLPDRIPQS